MDQWLGQLRTPYACCAAPWRFYRILTQIEDHAFERESIQTGMWWSVHLYHTPPVFENQEAGVMPGNNSINESRMGRV